MSKPDGVYVREHEVAVKAVLLASSLCQKVFQKLVSADTISKKDKSPVTVADYGAQALVNSLLHKSFPDDPIVGEEDSTELRENTETLQHVTELCNTVAETKMTSDKILEAIDLGTYKGGAHGRFWTLDPIDGTKGFLRGEQFAVCLALIVDGSVQLAVMGCPNLPVDLSQPAGERGCLFTATRGGGAYKRAFSSDVSSRVHVRGTTSAKDSIFCESVEAGHSSQGEAADIAARLGISKPSIRMDSQCKYGVIAGGDAEIYLRLPVSDTYEEKIWDHAGGSLLVQEAGGAVCDIHGRPLDFSVGRTLAKNKGVIATNGILHEQVLQAVHDTLLAGNK
ncbi:3',5'-bisphosphate nucleotidase [Phlyctochytrium arcticum]|nr:3',5'-bisphosphate nucleotidase [Phlyctochytrium arcticum]